MNNLKLVKFYSYWKQLTSGSVNRKIFSATIIVSLLTLCVKITAFAKEFVVAWKFGIGDDIDAYLIALVIPSFIANVLATSLKSALVPIFIQVRVQQGKVAAQKLFSGVVVLSILMLFIISSFMILTAPIYLPWIASGFDEKKILLTFRLLCVLSPIILLEGIICIWQGILNADEDFAVAGFSPIVIPLITIILLFCAKELGIYALTLGLVLGMLLEIIILSILLHKRGFSISPRWHGYDQNLQHFLDQYLPMISAAFLLCSAVPIDQAMAAMLSPGSVAALSYGNRLIAAPVALITTGLTASVIPYCAKMLASDDWNGIDNTLNKYLQLIFILTIPFAILIFVFSTSIVELVLERGAFTADDTHLVAQIQTYYALQIPFYIGNLFLIRLISSLKKNRILMWVSAYVLVVNICLNFLFMRMLGIKGIALSTSCVYVFSFILLYSYTKKYISRKLTLSESI